MISQALHQRLRLARTTRGLSQKQVADKISVPRTAITQIENGKRSVSTLELTELARTYGFSVSDLLEDEVSLEDEDIFVVLHRHAPSLQQSPVIRSQIERCVTLFKAGVRLKHLIGFKAHSGPPSYNFSNPRSISEAVLQGEQVAHQERLRLGLGDAPISDVAELFATQNIWVSSVDLPSEMSGLFIHHGEVGFAIVVNAIHPRERKRFSFAHEYAHSLFDRDHGFTVSTAQNAAELIECRANTFAASLLMPRNGVSGSLQTLGKGFPSRQGRFVFDAACNGYIENQIRSPSGSQRISYKDIATLAHHFGVSYQAAFYRLTNLGYLTSRGNSALLQQEDFGREYLSELEMLRDLQATDGPKRSNRELRREVAHLAIEAYRREEISRGRILELAAMLDIAGDVLLRLADATRET